MARRVRFTPDTKSFNKVPAWWPKRKPSYTTKTMRKRAVLREILSRVNRLLKGISEGAYPDKQDVPRIQAEMEKLKRDVERDLVRLEHDA